MPLGMVGVTEDKTPNIAGTTGTGAIAATATTSRTVHLSPSTLSSTSTSALENAYRSLHTTTPVTHESIHHDNRPACCNDNLYGPHTSTIRMNPYVRCVHDSGVPEIRSLKELLSLKSQPASAEPDTPCLRPTHGPTSTWQSCYDTSAFHADPAAHDTRLATGDTAANMMANGQASPLLVFTADSVATPNTFATVITHEKRIISHLTRRLRNSVRRHRDMPFGEPMEMVLSEGDEENREVDEEGEDGEPVEKLDDNMAAVASFDGVDGIDKENGEMREVPMLPSSTRDKADEAEATAVVAAGANAVHTPATTVHTSGSNSSSRSSMTAADSTSSQTGRSLTHPCTTTIMQSQQQRQQQRWLMQANNERIVSPHLSSAMFCEFPSVQQTATNARRHWPPQRAHTASKLQSLASPGQHNCRSSPHVHQHQQRQHAAMAVAAAALRSYPAPVAKLEESPYHYIMRNYIGGTFLYYSTAESKEYFLRLCHRVVAQVRPLLEQETLSPHHGLFPRINAPVYVFGDIHGNFEDLSFFLKHLLIFHDFNLTPANILCLGDYVDRGPFSLECVMLLFSLKVMNASKIVMLRGNHEDRVVCGDLQTYGRGCFLGQCQTVFGYTEGVKLFKEVTALFKYLPLAAELVIPSTPNIAFLRSQQTVTHLNLYVSQPAVLLHDATSAEVAQSPPSVLSSTQAGGEVANGESGSNVQSKSTTGLPQSPTAPATTAASDTSTTRATGYSTIADASLARGQPSRHEAHEERILCTHGGIPRFDRPPLEENALASLRSLTFPRMLTLFPNNLMVRDDPECAPDYFVRTELQTLWRRYPSTAPVEFTAASRREAAEANRTLNSSERPPASSSVKMRQSTSNTSNVSCASNNGGCCNEGGLASPDGNNNSICEEQERDRSGSTSPPASSTASLPNALPQGIASDKDSPLHGGRSLLQHFNSRDLLPLPTDEEVRKAWYTMFDLLWSDPTAVEPEENAAAGAKGFENLTNNSVKHRSSHTLINEWGFGINTRGSNVVSFSAKAVDAFLTAHHYSMLFRAHQEKAHGLRWSKGNKVLTIFSSSNYMGHGNGAGCVVVAANGEVQMMEKVCK